MVNNWEVLKEETGSDHKYISYKLGVKPQTKIRSRFKTKFNNHKKFIRNLKESATQLKIAVKNIDNTEQLDEFTEVMISKIREACKKGYKLKSTSKTQVFKWWTVEL